MLTLSHSNLPESPLAESCILYEIAGPILRTNRSVVPGQILKALHEGSTDPKYANIVLEFGAKFRDLDEGELGLVYEGTVFLLERAMGPLRCEAVDGQATSSVLPWGYAGVYARHIGPAESSSTDEPVDLNEKRHRALDSGHPDEHFHQSSQIPMTIWHLDHVATGYPLPR